jgi:carbonic anhydrase
VRNICGHIGPALNDILALDAFITLSEILIVHHTGKLMSEAELISHLTWVIDCGSTHFKEAQVKETLIARQPGNEEIENMVFGAVNE